MREYDRPAVQHPTGRVAVTIIHKDGSTEKIDKGVVPEGFYAPIPGDEVEVEGHSYEISGVADTPQSEFSLQVVAEEK
jgi:hypothetical protein